MNNLIITALNKTLSFDPTSFNRLKKLNNRILLLTILPIDISIRLKMTSAGFEACDESNADITINGKPSQFLKLTQTKSLYESGVKIIGDMGLAEEIKNIFSQLDIDWEGLIAEYTGDVPARQITRASRAGFNWLNETGNNLTQDVIEYLQEEIGILPSKTEMEIFTDENAKLRDAVARLEAKIN